MWIKRDFLDFYTPESSLPIKVLKGPRQVGKTALLEHMGFSDIVYFDDPVVYRAASENPRLFLDQLPNQLVLDEATRSPEIFPELKRRVDQARRENRNDLDIWITGSNQTLLKKKVSESLAGRANFFDFNSLSLHELGYFNMQEQLMRGGWPELRTNLKLDAARYQNDLIYSFIERDIAKSAEIKKTASFNLMLQLNAARVGQIYNNAEISQLCSVDFTTIKTWNRLLADNGLVEFVMPYSSNLNKRLTKSPKIFFQETALAVRLQGWSEFQPISVSPVIGHLFENIVFSEIHRFFVNRLMVPKIYYLRDKEKTEIDFLIELPNQKWVALEVKRTPSDFSNAQLKLIDSLKLNIVAKYTVSQSQTVPMKNCKNILCQDIWPVLVTLLNDL